MNGLDALALAIAWHEGPLRPLNRSYRNCNPGNLRSPDAPARDPGGFGIYPDFITGYKALLDDLAAKFTDGKNTHGLGQNSTLLELMNVYAPGQDGNNVTSYVHFIAQTVGLALGKILTPNSKLSEIWTPPATPLP